MTLSASTDILPAVQAQFGNSSLLVSDTNFVQSLKTCLLQLSMRDLLQKHMATDDGAAVTIDNTVFSIAVPARCRAILSIQLYDSDSERVGPLVDLIDGKRGYDQVMSMDASRSEPQWYTEYNDLIYLYQPPNGTYTYTIDYLATHANSTTIEFKDNFLEVIQKGTCFYFASNKVNAKYLEITTPLYSNALRDIDGEMTQEI